jgi:hypothetical protein
VTLRIAAVFGVLVGLAGITAYFHLLGKAPWTSMTERLLREHKDRSTAPASFEPMTLAAVAALPRRASLATRAPLERRGVVVEGYVQRMLRAVDGDFHLDLAPEPRGQAFSPYVVAEITPSWRRGSSTWSYDRLLDAFGPLRGGETPWAGGPRRVRLRGWLLYDEPHEVRPVRTRYPPALAAWEVHPVTGIEIWDDGLGRFQEYRR